MLAAALMERAGTGGALFRNLYRDFLGEAVDLLPDRSALRETRDAYASAATRWTRIADLIERSAQTDTAAPLSTAADECLEAVAIERAAMTRLAAL